MNRLKRESSIHTHRYIVGVNVVRWVPVVVHHHELDSRLIKWQNVGESVLCSVGRQFSGSGCQVLGHSCKVLQQSNKLLQKYRSVYHHKTIYFLRIKLFSFLKNKYKVGKQYQKGICQKKIKL